MSCDDRRAATRAEGAGLPPDEALRRAEVLPPRERLVIDNVPQDAWTAFQEALAEA